MVRILHDDWPIGLGENILGQNSQDLASKLYLLRISTAFNIAKLIAVLQKLIDKLGGKVLQEGKGGATKFYKVRENSVGEKSTNIKARLRKLPNFNTRREKSVSLQRK